MKPTLLVCVWMLLLGAIGRQLIAAPPPIEIMERTSVACPTPGPGHRGPAIGINAAPYSRGNIQGVRVVQDSKRRDLWYLGDNRTRRSAKFSPGNDVILKVNDQPVRSADEVLGNTFSQFHNELTILDLRTGVTRSYWVELP